VIRKNDDTGEVPYSQQGVTQRELMVMFCYTLGLLLLIHQLNTEFPKVEHPWYADNSGAGAAFTLQHLMFLSLKELRPAYGYYPKPSTSILMVSQHNLQHTKVGFFNL
jgi:hypothetical protein